MNVEERIRGRLAAAVAEADTPLRAADQLCQACVDLLDIDGAAISVVHEGATRGTFGSSNALGRRVDAFQFTFGEGPCLDAVRQRRPVLAEDLSHPAEQRWPAFSRSVVDAGVLAVFALPVIVATESIGALDFFRHRGGPLSEQALGVGLLAADLAALPLLDLIAEIGVRSSRGIVEGDQEDPWSELESLDRVEIHQATGFLIAQMDGAGPTQALVRLRARAFSTGQTASEVAQEILHHRLRLDTEGRWRTDAEADAEADGDADGDDGGGA
jgi:hypothetical protein